MNISNITFGRDTKKNMIKHKDTVLPDKEIFVEIQDAKKEIDAKNNRRLKVGDGKTKYEDLPYIL